MTSAFYGKAQGVVIVFDITDRETFNALPSWIHDVREVSTLGAMYILSLIPNIFSSFYWTECSHELSYIAVREQG